MNSTRKTLQLARLFTRGLSQSGEVKVHPKFLQLKQKQERFGIDNGIPVHLKGGLGDRLLYQFTALLTLTGFAMTMQVFYDLTFKK